MKITTNNSLTKLLQLLKTKLDALTSSIDAKPSIDDVTPSATSVFSSQKIQELIADKDFAYEKLTIQASEWTQNGSSNEWKYSHKVEGLSTEKCLFALVSNGKPLATTDYDLITYTNVFTSDSDHRFGLTTIGQPTTEISVCVLYFEIDKSYAQEMTGDYYMYGTIIKEPTDIDLTDLIDDSVASTDTVYSSSKTDTLLSAKADATTVTNLTNTVNTKADQTAVDTLSASINAKPSINDEAASTTSVYSSSKVEELVASGDSKPILIASPLSYTAWEEVIDENDTYYQAKINLSTSEDYSSKIALVDLDTSIIGHNPALTEMYINEYSKITQAHIEWVGTAQTRAPSPSPDTGCFVIFQAKEKPNIILYFLTLLADKDDIVPTVDYIEDELNGRVMLTNRAPVSSGSSTIYEFTSPVTLTSFTANSDEDIPYYADITNLSSYITDTNKIAVVNPDTSETNSTLLRYTEVIDGGSIRCYFAEQPTSYAIKSVEIRNASLVSVQTTALISFTIDGTSYQAEEGMTWGEWVNSSYDTGNFYTIGTNVCQKPGADVYAVVGAVSTSAITANSAYFTEPWR